MTCDHDKKKVVGANAPYSPIYIHVFLIMTMVILMRFASEFWLIVTIMYNSSYRTFTPLDMLLYGVWSGMVFESLDVRLGDCQHFGRGLEHYRPL